MIFETSVRLEIGRKFENCLKSASGFFRDGDKAVTFNALGILQFFSQSFRIDFFQLIKALLNIGDKRNDFWQRFQEVS